MNRSGASTTGGTTSRITGRVLPPEGFRVHKTEGHIDLDAALAVLAGDLAVHLVSNYVPSETCERIVQNFWNSPQRTPRYGDGEDGVEGYFIGASHIEKSTDQYLVEAAAAVKAVRSLFEGVPDPVDAVRKALAKADGVIGVRAAMYEGRAAGSTKAVCWNQVGPFQLMPHDDVAQLSDPPQHGFEIQQLERVMAVNVYPHVPERVGQLQVWNVEPDTETRDLLGLTHSGFPYPPQLLTEYASVVVPVSTGDLCLLNGNLVHAVLGAPDSNAGHERLLLTCFVGKNGSDELVWWT